MAGKQLQHLTENAGYSCHGGGVLPGVHAFSTQTVAEFRRCRSNPNLGNYIPDKSNGSEDDSNDEVLEHAFRIPHDDPPGHLLVLTCYIDESSQTSSEWMSVAGFIGTDEQWKACVPAWREAISPRDHLHMKELRFTASRAEKRIKPLLERAGAVPDKCGLTPVFGVVRYSDYADLITSEDEKIFCGYIACCLPMVINTLRGIPASERVELVFERQDTHWETLDLALSTIVHYASAQTRLPDGRSKLANWRSVEKGDHLTNRIG